MALFDKKNWSVKKALWVLFLGGILGVTLLITLFSFQELPSFDELENPKTNQATEIYASNGAVLGRLYIENRVVKEYNELNPYLIKALISTEDIRFHKHSGIDFRALGRVLVKTVFMQNSSSGGGSTITQQLAKLLYSDRNFKGMNVVRKSFALLSRKVKEWITAVKLERAYTKEEILAIYLNKFNFINGAYGIEAASEVYFSKTQDSLNVEEAAMLVGMLKNPALYNPMRRPEMVVDRRNTVLNQMLRYGELDKELGDSIKAIPLNQSGFNRRSHKKGLAPYFRQVVANEVKSILAKEEYRMSDGTKYNLYRDGLKIYTTIDTTIQRIAEDAIKVHMPQIQDKLWRTWKTKDPWTHKDDEETTDEQIAIRENSLNKLIRESSRYRTIVIKKTVSKLNALDNAFGISIKDYEINRIIDHEDGKILFKDLVDKGYLSKSKKKLYDKILASSEWRELSTTWKEVAEEALKIMNTPVAMKVFTYENDAMEKDTTMTPIDSIRYHRMFLQLGSMAVDPLTGYVKSWVGGINFKYFQFDHVTSSRQVGSTFKPFVYATAIGQQALSPCYEVYDIPYTIHQGESNFDILEDWTPKNSSGEYSGEKFTLKEALRKSKNTVSVYLIKQLGDTEAVRGLAHSMGIDSSARYSNGRYRVPRQPSICLGSADLTVKEMTGAYTAFANNGIYNKPVYITRIEDKNGKLIYQHVPESKIALDSKTNYVMVEMLRNVVYGAGGFHGRKSDFGGKTGTTDKHVDGWFMGVTPNLVIGTWVGGEDAWIRFLSLRNGQGAKMARPYFAAMLEQLEELDEEVFDKRKRFYRPPGDLGVILDCENYTQIDSNRIQNVDLFQEMVNDGDTSSVNDEDFGGDFQ